MARVPIIVQFKIMSFLAGAMIYKCFIQSSIDKNKEKTGNGEES